MTVAEQDTFGNATTTAETVTVSSNSSGTTKFATTSGGTATTTVSIAAGFSSVNFYYQDTKAGSPTITAAVTGLTSATQVETINAGAVNKLVITSTALSATASTTANMGPITVQEQDVNGNPTTTAETVSLTSNSAGTESFSLTSGGASITTVAIPANSSSATFYYGDPLAGTPTITASVTGLTPGTQTETVTAGAVNKLVITSTALSAKAGITANMGPITVQEQDATGNPTTTAETVSLSSSSTGTKLFAATSGGTTPITTVSIAAGSSSATFYYGDSKAGSPVITAAVSGLTSGTQTETITAAAIAFVQQAAATGGAALTSQTITLPANSTVGNTLVLLVSCDHSNNATVSTVSGGGVTTWSKATATAAASGAGMAEIWYGAVTSAATVLTVTLSGSTNWQLADLAEYSGINTTSPLDGATGTTGSASSFTAGPITTTSAGDLVVTDVWTGVANSASTVGPSTPGYTVLSETKAGGSFYRGWAAYQVVGAAGSQSAAWIQPSSISGTYATAIAAFKP